MSSPRRARASCVSGRKRRDTLDSRRVATGSSRRLRSLEAGRQLRRVVAGAEVEQVVRRRGQRAVQRRRLQQPLQHAAGAAVLQTLVRGQRVLGPVPPVAELAHVQRVGLLVLVLEVSFQRVITRECPAAVRTLLGLVDAAGCGRGHTEGRYSFVIDGKNGGRVLVGLVLVLFARRVLPHAAPTPSE